MRTTLAQVPIGGTAGLGQRYGEERGLISGKVADQGTGPGEETMGAGSLVANTLFRFVEEDGSFDVIGQIVEQWIQARCRR